MVKEMRRYLSLWFIILLIPISVSGCGEKAEQTAKASPIDKIIVTVNGSPITVGDVNFSLKSAHSLKLTPEVKRKTVDGIIVNELIYQEGLRLGLDKDTKYRAAVAKKERRLKNFQRMEIARRVYNSAIAARVTISPEDVKRYFEENKKRIRTEFHLLQLVFSDEAQAQAALTRIKNGESFEAIAEKMHQEIPKGKREPWDMGFLKWNRILTDWQDAIYSLKKGEIGGVVHGKRTGFRIFKLLERREDPKVDLDRMRSSILNRLRDKKVGDAYDQFVKELRANATIVKGEGWALLEK